MRSRIIAVTLALAAVSVPRSVAAQTMITIEAPVKLTQLSPQILEVQLICGITSSAIVSPTPGRIVATDELPVVGRQLITTMRVVFAFADTSLQAAVGKTATYECGLKVRTTSGWGGFSDAAANPEGVTPVPTLIKGTFVW